MTVPKSPRVFASISGGRPESFIFGFSPAVSCLLLYLICGSRHASRDRVTLPYFVLCCVICIRNIAHALMSAGCPLYVADLSLCCMRGKRHSCAACLFRVWLVWLVDDVSADARFNFLSVPSLQCGHWWELYRVCACVRGVWLALTASVIFFSVWFFRQDSYRSRRKFTGFIVWIFWVRNIAEITVGAEKLWKMWAPTWKIMQHWCSVSPLEIRLVFQHLFGRIFQFTIESAIGISEISLQMTSAHCE